MAALKVIGVIVLLLCLLALVRVGVLVTFDDALRAELRIGPLHGTIVPAKENAPKAAKKPQSNETSDTQNAAKKKHTLPKPSISELRDLLTVAWRTLKKVLRRVCRRVRIDPLEVYATIGGSDPAEIAKSYGYLNAAMWSLMPHAEELFHIPDPSLHLRMDYNTEKTSAQGKMGVSIRIGDLVIIVCALAIPLLKWFLRFKKAHANDPLPPDAAATDTAQNIPAQKETQPTEPVSQQI